MLLTTEFLTEVLAQAEESETDYSDVTGQLYGVVYFSEDEPVAIDVHTGMRQMVEVFANRMLAYNRKYGHTSFRLFPLEADGSSKATYIRRTAMLLEG